MTSIGIEDRLDLVRGASPVLLPMKRKRGFEVVLPERCFATVFIDKTDQGFAACIDDLVVNEDLRKHGIGSRLVRSVFRYCAEIGVAYVESDIISSTATRNHGKIFGEAALHLMYKTGDSEIELPLTVEQASLSIDQVQAIWEAASPEQQEQLDAAIITRVYLKDIDTTGWELPLPFKR